MDLRIVIPVKPFAEAKQRLAPLLNAQERAQLARDFFRHVFATTLGFARAPSVIVVSRDAEILSFAEAGGAIGLAEDQRSGLNAALAQAAEFARREGASRLLIVASDLPLLSRSDLEAMSAAECAIGPDRRGIGTNALLWPAGPEPGFHFGDNSFARHSAAAKAAGSDPQRIVRPGLACDIDLPDDLLDWRRTSCSAL